MIRDRASNGMQEIPREGTGYREHKRRIVLKRISTELDKEIWEEVGYTGYRESKGRWLDTRISMAWDRGRSKGYGRGRSMGSGRGRCQPLVQNTASHEHPLGIKSKR